MNPTLTVEATRIELELESAALEAELASRTIPGATGAEVWRKRVREWTERGVLESVYSRRPRKTVTKKTRRLSDLDRAKNLPPKVTTGGELVQLGEKVWQDRRMLAKALEMWGVGMSSGAIRQAQCSRIGWLRRCKAAGHPWHQIFRCGLRFCPLCMSSVYEALFYDAVERLDVVVTRLVPEWPISGRCPLRVIAKIDFTIRNDGQMPSAEKVRWFNKAIRKFFIRLAKQNGWKKDEWGAAWCAEFGPGNTNLHAHAVYCGPFIQQKKREASALWSKVIGEYAIVSVKAAKSFRHALRHAIKYPAASWKYFSASPERLAALEKAFYTVKRFHTIGAFYDPPTDPKVPPTVLTPYDKCPTCGSQLVEIADPRWLTLPELTLMGSKDFSAHLREQRLRGNFTEGARAGPP